MSDAGTEGDAPERFVFRADPYPLDEDGFALSVDVDDAAGASALFERYGVVVFRNVLDADECDASVADLWRHLREVHSPELRPDDPDSWDKWWPQFGHLGILGGRPAMTPGACQNRQNPRLHRAYTAVYGHPRLRVAIERYGAHRPTVGVRMRDGSVVDKPEWRTLPQWLHIDCNPWTKMCSTYGFQAVNRMRPYSQPPDCSLRGNMDRYLKTQAILALVDCRAEDGGFHAVPGFHHQVDAWLACNMGRCRISALGHDPLTVQLAETDACRASAQSFPLRMGSLLVWHAMLPHGNYPNRSPNWRMVQYTKMLDAADDEVDTLDFIYPDASGITLEFPEGFHLSDLGKRLYGRVPWESHEPSTYNCSVQ
jgi:ectoine hydroxylase-related dioxygenase (phytanoyl-CoA dioxygenase family)